MKFGVLGILCRIFIAFSIANHLNVNFSILINWILEESSDFPAIDKPYLCGFCSEGFLFPLGARTGCVFTLALPDFGPSWAFNIIKLLKVEILGTC